MRSPTPPERVRFLPSVLCTPRSSSRPGCRSLTPVTRVRTPLGALSMRPWCQDGSTRRCQRCGPGSSPGGRSRWGSWWPGRWLASTRAGFDSPGLHSFRRSRTAPAGLARENPGRRALSGPQLPLRAVHRASRCRMATHALGRAWWRGSAVSRVGRVRLPSRALTRRSSADRAPPCDGGGRRFESSRRDTTTTGRLGRRRSDMAVERGSIPRSSISP